MKAKKKLLWLALAAMLAVCAVVGAVIVNAAEPETGKDGMFNGSPAHVDENGNLYIDEINFPDEGFRDFVQNGRNTSGTTGFDTNKDGVLTLDEIAAVTEIYCYGPAFPDDPFEDDIAPIHDLSGIEFFTDCEILECSSNPLTSLDVSKLVNLKELYCGDTEISSLTLNNPSLVKLSCGGYGRYYYRAIWSYNYYVNNYDNLLSALDVSSCEKLEYVDFSFDKITELILPDNSVIEYINCSGNPIGSIELEQHPKLTELSACDTNIAVLDCSKNTELKILDCKTYVDPVIIADNKYHPSGQTSNINSGIISNIIVQGCSKLEVLDCTGNSALTELDCSGCSLKELYLDWCTNLEKCNIAGNNLLFLYGEYTSTDLDTDVDNSQHYYDTVSATTLAGGQGYVVDMMQLIMALEHTDLYSFEIQNRFACISFNNIVGEYKYDPNTGTLFLKELPETLTYTFTSIANSNITFDVTLHNIEASETEVEIPTSLEGTGSYGNKVYVTFPEEDVVNYVNTEISASKYSSYNIEKALSNIYGEYEGLKVHVSKVAQNDHRYISVFVNPTSILTVKIHVPRGWDPETTAIYYIDDEHVEVVDTEIDGDYLIFTGSHFKLNTNTVRDGSYVFVNTASKLIEDELVDIESDAYAKFPENETEYYENVELKVEKNSDVATENADKAFKDEYRQYVPYEVELIKDGEPIQPKTMLTVRLPIPEEWKENVNYHKWIFVYYVDSEGQKTDMNAVVSEDGNYMVFTIYHLSTYALVDTSTKIEPEKTPDETTKEPDDTTKAPDDTTKAPDDTTKTPDDTTKAPDTTATPVETTSAPVETTAAPAETTAAPAETTAAPTETTAAPTETTAAPAVTTAAPSSGSTAEPPKTGGTVNAVAAIVAAMCTCAAGAVVAYGVRKKK